jgi:16S rRNA (uracil1498-N3)-methyltransferase
VNPALRHSAAHVFVSDLDQPVLDDDDDHHLRRVLRLRSGATLSIADGSGRWAPAVLTEHRIERCGDVESATQPRPGGTVVCAIPKGDRSQLLVQKCTEVGIGAVLFTTFERSVVRWEGARGEQHRVRMQRVARQAAMQSRRLFVPTVGLATLDDARCRGSDVAVADIDGQQLTAECSTVVIGPEGGLTDDELARWHHRVRLSSHVLRVETAAIVAAVGLSNHAV